MKHPFTIEDIDAAIGEADSWHYDVSDEVMATIVQAAWDSAVKRGAIEPLYPGRMLDKGIFEKPGYFIALPEDKT
jgi:hypothetical protein